MKMLRKIIDCERLKTSWEDAYDEVNVSKVTNLQRTDYNSVIKRPQILFGIFSENQLLKRMF